MNSHTAQVFFYELRRNVRRKGYLFTTFGIPLLVLALIVGYQFISSRTSSAESQNDTAQTLAQQLDFENVKHAGYVDLSGMFGDPGDLAALLTPYPDEATAQAALGSGEIALYYVIASDYMTSGEVTIVQPRLNISEVQSAPIRRLILNTLSQGVEPKIFQRLINPSNVTETNLALIGAEFWNAGSGIVLYRRLRLCDYTGAESVCDQRLFDAERDRRKRNAPDRNSDLDRPPCSASRWEDSGAGIAGAGANRCLDRRYLFDHSRGRRRKCRADG